MRSARLLTLAAAAALLTGCGTPTVTSTPDAIDTAAQEAAISAPSGAPTITPGAAEPAPTPTPTSPTVAGVGDTITLEDDSETQKIAVKVAKIIKNGAPANDFAKPKSGKRLYGVEIVLRNVGTETLNATPSSGAKAVDSEGQEYEKSLFGEINGAHNLGEITLAPGKIRRGVIVFEVPKNAKMVEFMMALSSGYADQKGSWTVG